MDETLLVEALANLSDEAILKATLDAAARKKLPDSDYAYIDSDGGRHLPIADEEHVRAALSRFGQQSFASADTKRKAAKKVLARAKKLGVEVADDDPVRAAAGESVAKGEPAGLFVTIEKADLEEGVIYGVASVANLVDREGDVIRPAELRKAAHDFLANYNGAFDDTHGYGGAPSELAGKLVESWIDGDAWRIGFRPDDIAIAKAAADGEYVGFSIFGEGKRVEVTV